MPHSAEATPNLVRIGAVVGVKSNMRASKALVQTSSTQEIVVGLIDTGCDVTNKNLNIVGGMDFTSDDSYGLDGNGHGTHVAGERVWQLLTGFDLAAAACTVALTAAVEFCMPSGRGKDSCLVVDGAAAPTMQCSWVLHCLHLCQVCSQVPVCMYS